jgi:hypothetical protein
MRVAMNDLVFQAFLELIEAIDIATEYAATTHRHFSDFYFYLKSANNF